MDNKFISLGQNGFLIFYESLKILIDPYLSNSVEILDPNNLKRKVPIKFNPNELFDVDWVLITHEHIDHCDPLTLPLLHKNNPNAFFLGPSPVRKKLLEWGISIDNILPLKSNPNLLSNGLEISKHLKVTSIPASHPTLTFDENNQPHALGWLLQSKNKTIYNAGDTNICDELLLSLKNFPKIHTAILPVNEDNFFRRRKGIIGNMSIREAFEFSSEIGFEEVLPVHWDMFEINSVFPEEIYHVYSAYKWPFKLIMDSRDITF